LFLFYHKHIKRKKREGSKGRKGKDHKEEKGRIIRKKREGS
jgi:hypothetical protein